MVSADSPVAPVQFKRAKKALKAEEKAERKAQK